ncbi:MAG: phosphoribosylformylglycinamidine synthase subunit PurS [Gemmatimonadaceae bacterium]
MHIAPRRGILDPQGKAIAEALHALGFAGIRDARMGKQILLELDAPDPAHARAAVGDMCDRLLANPVTEDYHIAPVESP